MLHIVTMCLISRSRIRKIELKEPRSSETEFKVSEFFFPGDFMGPTIASFPDFTCCTWIPRCLSACVRVVSVRMSNWGNRRQTSQPVDLRMSLRTAAAVETYSGVLAIYYMHERMDTNWDTVAKSRIINFAVVVVFAVALLAYSCSSIE